MHVVSIKDGPIKHIKADVETDYKESRVFPINSCPFTNWISTGTMISPHPYG